MTSTKVKLRAAPTGRIRVDKSAGIIRDVAIATVGEASGHGFALDLTSLRQVERIIRDAGSVPCRLTHPDDPDADALLTTVGVTKNPRLVGDVLRGDIHLGDFARSLPGKGDVRAFILEMAETAPAMLGLSAVISYTTEPTEGGALPVARVTEVLAVDLVGRPAANRHGLLSEPSIKETKMNPQIKMILSERYGLSDTATDEQAKALFDALPDDVRAEIESEAESRVPDDGEQVVLAEKRRQSGIRRLASMLHIPSEETERLVTAGLSAGEAKDRMLKYLSNTCQPIRSIAVGDDRNVTSLKSAAADAVGQRAGLAIAKPHPRAAMFAGMPVLEIGRRYMESQGIDLTGISRAGLARMILNPEAAPGHIRPRLAMLTQSTSDFGSVLTTNFNASLRQGYTENPTSWPLFAKRGTLPDFTTGERPILSAVSTPELTNEGGEVKYSSLTDKRETIQLAKYTRGVRLTLETLVNDRLGAFTDIFARMGQACRRLEDDLIFAQLLTAAGLGQTMTETAKALFHDDHKNIVTGTGNVGAPSVQTLAAARTLLAKKTGLKGEVLNLQPAALIVPPELATVAEQLVASLVDPSAKNDTPNPAWIRGLAVVSDARMSAYPAAWILAASPAQIDGAEVAFLEDESNPVMRQEIDFDTEDQKYAVRHVVGARVLDHRGFVRNPGA